jgi:hypothetical protein
MSCDIMVNMRSRLPPGLVSDRDVGFYAIQVASPHLERGVSLDSTFWNLARQTKVVTEAEVRMSATWQCGW